MKICCRCNLEKELTSFNRRSSRKDGLQSFCKSCQQLDFKTKYHSSNKLKSQLKLSKAKNRKRNKEFIFRYKRFCGCYVCKENEPCALDLHHLDPSQKDYHPSSMLDCTLDNLKKEFRKCIVLCSNCHRKVHNSILSLWCT